MGIFRFILKHSENIFWLTLVVAAFGTLIVTFRVMHTAGEARHQRELATDYEVYCVAKSGEVLFDDRVADAYTQDGAAIIRLEDDAREATSIIGDCRITPIINR